MTITLCNGKGGAGKTTTALLLAGILADAGYTVGVVDRDKQQTATKCIDEIQPDGYSIAQAGQLYDIRIIDTPPNIDAPELINSIRESDIVIVVSSPSPADLWTSRDTAEAVKRHKRKHTSARLLFAQVHSNTILARDMDIMADHIGLKPLTNYLSYRQSYQHALLYGIKALDTRAKEQLLLLALEIAGIK